MKHEEASASTTLPQTRVVTAALTASCNDDNRSIEDCYARINSTGMFTVEDIHLISSTFKKYGNAPNTPWDNLRNKHLILPDWFRMDLDPISDEYLQQQKRLWNVIADVDRDYVPRLDEAEESWGNIDPVRQPGYYKYRNPFAVTGASDHIIATGMLMKHSGLKPGMWALEYGAGFGQTALALARLGVNTDTVDISQLFCDYIKAQADFFNVNLTPFNAEFGTNPRGDHKYDLIWFYESFHHCLDFKNVVAALKNHLAPGGKILMAGEPIIKRSYEAVPYPWGLRLESEVIAVIRNNHWFELGYTEDFIADFFTNNGYIAECFECPMTAFGVTYSFTPRSSRIDLSKHWLLASTATGWHMPESNGRWTRSEASLAVDQTETFGSIEITASNHHRKSRCVVIEYGQQTIEVSFAAGEKKTIRIEAAIKSPRITIKCKAIRPGGLIFKSKDRRLLGIFVHHVDYV